MDPQQDRQNSQAAKHILLTSLIHQGCLTTLMWVSQENYLYPIPSTKYKSLILHSHYYFFFNSLNVNQLIFLLIGKVKSHLYFLSPAFWNQILWNKAKSVQHPLKWKVAS